MIQKLSQHFNYSRGKSVNGFEGLSEGVTHNLKVREVTEDKVLLLHSRRIKSGRL